MKTTTKKETGSGNVSNDIESKEVIEMRRYSFEA